MTQKEFCEYVEIIEKKNNVQMAEQLWNNKFTTMKTENLNETILHVAVKSACPELVTFILSKGVKVDERDCTGWSALHLAADNGNDRITSILIEHDANVNLCDDIGASPLYRAAYKGNDKVTSMLIEHGANCGRIPLDFAKLGKHTKCICILKEALRKANIARDIVQSDNVKEFKKKYAISGLKLNREIVNLIGQIRPAKIIEYIASSPITDEEVSVLKVWQGEPLMHEIYLYRSIKSTHCWLFENSVSVELINKDLLLNEDHALQLAIDSQSEIMINEVIKLLKDDNDILNRILGVYEGRTNNKYLNILRKRKCVLDGFIKRGYSRLDIAVMDCSRRMLLYLLEKENDTKIITQALSIAIERNCEECIHILLSERNIEYSYENKLGQTLLHLSVESGNKAVCHTLVEKCTNLTERDYLGFTALQRAVTYNEEDLIEQIINKEKCWNSTVYIAKKPKEIACFGGSSNIVSPLEKVYKKQFHSIYDKLTEKETTLSLHAKANNVISEAILENISKCDVEFLDELRNTMLHTAVSNCNLDMCKTIISISKKTIYTKNIENISPLRLAVQMAKDSDTDNVKILNIIQYLISMGAQLEQDEPGTRSILQEAITIANEKLLIALIETEEPVTALTEDEFKYIAERQFFTFLHHLTGKLHKEFASKLITECTIMNLFILEQYSTLTDLLPHLNCEVKKAVINEYLYIAYKQRNEDLFTKLCDADEFEMKLLNNGESIMTHIIRDDNKEYVLRLLEAKYVQQLLNTSNYLRELPVHLIIKKKWFNLAHLLLKENEIIDDENAEGDTAIAVLMKQLESDVNTEQINEILNLVYTMIDKNVDIYKVSNVSSRSPISYGGRYRYKIEQYYEKQSKVKQQLESTSTVGAVGGGADTEAVDKTSDKKVTTKMCYICNEREINCSLDCGHAFCTVCVEKVDNCPNCRGQITNPRKLYL